MSLSDNLISYWAMEEASGNALDSHGSNDLTETSGTIGTTTGVQGNAREFVAADSEYFEITDNADLSVGDIAFTLAFWVNFTSSPSATQVLGKHDANNCEYQVRDLSFRVSSGTGFANFTTVGSGVTISTGVWYFVRCWHDPTSNVIGIQVNNNSAQTAAHSAGSYDSGAPFQIGGWPAYGVYVSAKIDEVGFWKRLLTSDEHTELYNSGAGRDYAYITGGGGGGAASRLTQSKLLKPVALFG